MPKFIQHTGIVLPLNITNVDTDNIIPKQFLKATTRSNFSKYLFFDWRFLENTSYIPNPDFILNHPKYQKSSILLTRNNFGCGSSREHAVWALIDYGFKVIIASSFSDIFYKNSLNNHLLPIILPELEINSLFNIIHFYQSETLSATVNLHKKIIYIKNKKYSFEISDTNQNYMIHNLDRIDLTLKYESLIQEYEDKQPSFFS